MKGVVEEMLNTAYQWPSLNLLDPIKAVANSLDVPYQSLIKIWLQKKDHNPRKTLTLNTSYTVFFVEPFQEPA